MTYKEAAQKNPKRVYVTSEGDTHNKICYNIYGSNEGYLVKGIMALNQRYDWDGMRAGQEIVYLDKDVASKVYEV